MTASAPSEKLGKVLDIGDYIHVITRRKFERDLRRHFVGEILAISDGLARVAGSAFVFNPSRSEFVQRPGTRVRIFGLGDADQVINVLPRDAKLAEVKYVRTDKGRLIVTDGASFTLDVNEFGNP